MTSKQKLLLIGVVIITLFFRFYQIMAMPGGLFPDEAANGLDINLMQQGQIQPFYERGNGREALFFYMLWGSVETLGKGPWQHHIISALVGALAVIVCFLVARRLFSMFADNDDETARATNYALWAAFFMAVSTWHIVLSRTAFRANLIPLFAGLTIYTLLLTAGAQTVKRRIGWAVITGTIFGLGFYSYIAYRILVPILGVLVLWPFIVDVLFKPRFEQIKRFFLPTLLFVMAALITLAPLLYYFHTHPGSFIGRSTQVSVFNPDLNGGHLWSAIGEVTKQSILAYFFEGDLNWRHNISGYPFLSILVSPFFALGLILSTFRAARYALMPRKYRRDWVHFLLAGWFWGMLLPVVTTAEGIPHGLRSIGTIPAVFIMAAFGLKEIFRIVAWVIAPFYPHIMGWRKKLLDIAFSTKTVVYILALILQAYFAYFVYAANSPENFYAFRSDLTTISEYLKTEGSKTNTYLVLDKFSVQTVDYFTSVDGANPTNPANQPYQQVDPEDSWKLTGLKPGDKIVFAQSSLFDIKKFKQYHPEAMLIREDRNKFNQTVMGVYVIK